MSESEWEDCLGSHTSVHGERQGLRRLPLLAPRRVPSSSPHSQAKAGRERDVAVAIVSRGSTVVGFYLLVRW